MRNDLPIIGIVFYFLYLRCFRIYDANNDGYVDFVEFMVVYTIMSDGSVEEVLTKLFRLFDVNSDGVISKKEMARLVKDMYGLLKRDDPTVAAKVSNAFGLKCCIG